MRETIFLSTWWRTLSFYCKRLDKTLLYQDGKAMTPPRKHVKTPHAIFGGCGVGILLNILYLLCKKRQTKNRITASTTSAQALFEQGLKCANGSLKQNTINFPLELSSFDLQWKIACYYNEKIYIEREEEVYYFFPNAKAHAPTEETNVAHLNVVPNSSGDDERTWRHIFLSISPYLGLLCTCRETLH